MADLATTERIIAKALAELESESGSKVESIEICDIEITQIDSPAPRVVRRVKISLTPSTRAFWDY